MPPDTPARREFLEAFAEIARRIAASLDRVAPEVLPIRMYVAGGVALHHEDAYDDSHPMPLPGVDGNVLDVRLLSPLDLAVSKLGRFSGQDRDDIAALARQGLVDPQRLRGRAEEALAGYVGDTERLRNTIDIVCRMIA